MKMLKEGVKRSRRDMYIVLECNADDTMLISKVLDAVSSKPASISPHDDRHRYRVKPTDVILARNSQRLSSMSLLPMMKKIGSGIHRMREAQQQIPKLRMMKKILI